MGYINNQWLKGRPMRLRKHAPIAAKITAKPVTYTWDKEHDVRASLLIERSDGDYQFLLFNDEDLTSFENVVGSADPATRQRIALAAMSEAADEELVSFMQALFEQRKKRRRKS